MSRSRHLDLILAHRAAAVPRRRPKSRDSVSPLLLFFYSLFFISYLLFPSSPPAASLPPATIFRPSLSLGNPPQPAPGMIEDTAALAAAAELIASLACDPASFSLRSVGAGSSVKLPGRENPAKHNLEIELEKLAQRISQLESRATVSATAVFPETPNEVNDTIFNDESDTPVNGRPAAPQLKLSQAQQGSLDSPNFVSHQLTKEALQGLHAHVDDQSKLLDNQRQELAGVTAQLLEQKQLQERAWEAMEQERVASLERELRKHQQANEAFQKALREIGEIVTAVARGDLSMKAGMESVEMDPEITTFKRTINAMMDQLQTFASEVSRVAREVGTEGLLGGQARIGGVDGVWKELTDNGMALFMLF